MTSNQQRAFQMGAMALAAGVVALPFGAAHADIITTYVGATNNSTSINIQFQGATVFVSNTVLDGSAATDVVNSELFYSLFGQSAIKLGSGVSVGPAAFADPQQDATFFAATNSFYVGLEVTSTGNNNFGYAEYTNTDTLQGYAFETTANTPITTADIETSSDTPDPVASSVPEPASMALLAAGVAGVGIIRRRRNTH